MFGLHVRTSEDEIREIFERYGTIEKIHMVYDANSRGFRGYCFIYYNKVREATEALNHCNGIEIKERRIRVDYSKTKRAHTPTPGYYRGKRNNRDFDRPRRRRRSFSRSGIRGNDRDTSRRGNDRDPSRRRYEDRPLREDDRPRHRSRERHNVSSIDVKHGSNRDYVRKRSKEREQKRSSPPVRRETERLTRRRDRS